jgi:hypothetical protein
VIVATVETPGSADFIFVRNGLAYVADGRAGIHVIDARNPAGPKFLGTKPLRDTARGVFADEFFMYATDDSGVLTITRAQCGGQ